MSPDHEQFSTWRGSDIIWAFHTHLLRLQKPMTSTGLQIYASKWLFPTSKSYYVHLWDVPSTNVPPISWWPIPQVLLQVFLTKGKSKMIQFQLSEVTFSFKLNHRKKAWNKFSPKPGPPPPQNTTIFTKISKNLNPSEALLAKSHSRAVHKPPGYWPWRCIDFDPQGMKEWDPSRKKNRDEWHHNCNWLFCLSNGIHLCLCRNSWFFLCRYIFGSEIKEWGPFSGIILGIPNEKRLLPSDAPVPSISSTTRLFNVNVCLWKSIALQGII